MNARLILSALALAIVPHALSAQSGAEANATVALEATARAGLPEAPVRRTIEEGRARGASEAQVDRAALAVHARLHASRDALRDESRPEPTSAEIVAGADALLSGARPTDLHRVRDAAPAERSLAASLSALAELTSRGENPSAVSGAIAAGIASGVSDNDLLRLAADGTLGSRLDGTGAGTGAIDAAIGAAAGADLLGATSTIGASVVGGLSGGL